MAVQLAHYRFTRAEYHRMAEAGILNEDSPVELIEGEILEMSPIGLTHKGCVDRTAAILFGGVRGAAIVRVRNPVVLGEHCEPRPDLVLLRPRDDFYTDSDETPEDVLLIVEVADSSEVYDRQIKAPLCARHAIPEFWIVSLNRDQVILFRDATPRGYTTTRIARRGETINPLAFPDLTIPVEAILG